MLFTTALLKKEGKQHINGVTASQTLQVPGMGNELSV